MRFQPSIAAVVLLLLAGCSSARTVKPITDYGYVCPREAKRLTADGIHPKLLMSSVQTITPRASDETDPGPYHVNLVGEDDTPFGTCVRVEIGTPLEFHSLRPWEREQLFKDFPDVP